MSYLTSRKRAAFNFTSCAVIVAHPDDETLWAGGTILMHPECSWTIVSLCRKSDPDRAPKFFKALNKLNATGVMGDLYDGPDQISLAQEVVERTVIDLLPRRKYDLILTHSIRGEYTRHSRHEETAKAVASLWLDGKIISDELWLFAFEDDGGSRLPRAVVSADEVVNLPEGIIKRKKSIIENIYGFSKKSWEARTSPAVEAFWRFSKPALTDLRHMEGKVKRYEDSSAL